MFAVMTLRCFVTICGGCNFVMTLVWITVSIMLRRYVCHSLAVVYVHIIGKQHYAWVDGSLVINMHHGPHWVPCGCQNRAAWCEYCGDIESDGHWLNLWSQHYKSYTNTKYLVWVRPCSKCYTFFWLCKLMRLLLKSLSCQFRDVPRHLLDIVFFIWFVDMCVILLTVATWYWLVSYLIYPWFCLCHFSRICLVVFDAFKLCLTYNI